MMMTQQDDPLFTSAGNYLRPLLSRESFKRWYDHDPVLLQLMRVLYHFEMEVTPYVKLFLAQVEEQVGTETLNRFYQDIERNTPKGRRWYDDDPVMFRLVELFRVIPQDVQRRTAETFLDIMKAYGIDLSLLAA